MFESPVDCNSSQTTKTVTAGDTVFESPVDCNSSQTRVSTFAHAIRFESPVDCNSSQTSGVGSRSMLGLRAL